MTTPTRRHWTSEKAAHLLRRAAFGGTAAEIGQAARDGCQTTVDHLIAGVADESAARPMAVDRAVDDDSFAAIQLWWIRQMLRSEHPLRERMTFFWHNHFATSIVTVKEPALMLAQNRLFRQHALGNFRDLLAGVASDPAMLLWLDNHLNRKEHPNENFGRELLELFTLGLGNYGEEDVLAAVRAFTGWTLTSEGRDARFRFADDAHDHEPKRFRGNSGDWDGGDILRFLCASEAHAKLIAAKLFAWFAYDDPRPELVERLARIYLEHDAQLAPVVRAILISPEMYSEKARWSRVKSPLDHVVIACRQLGIASLGEPLAASMNQQGLALFNPPDVSGWKQGMSWINSWSLLARMNFAAEAAASFDPAAVRGDAKFARPEELVDAYLRALGPLSLDASLRGRLARFVAPDGVMPAGEAIEARERGVVRLILSMPEWQLN